VVTFTLTEKRALGLSAAAREVLLPDARKHFLFAANEGVSLANPQVILSEILMSPEQDETGRTRLRLVPDELRKKGS
jgi:hypothetical protein